MNGRYFAHTGKMVAGEHLTVDLMEILVLYGSHGSSILNYPCNDMSHKSQILTAFSYFPIQLSQKVDSTKFQ
jgi:hypothetical protein